MRKVIKPRLTPKMPAPFRTSQQILGYMSQLSYAYDRETTGPVTLDRNTARGLYEIALQSLREERSRERMLSDMADEAEEH
jgi:hypothetical protein